jgi:hypothetical protein
LLEDSRIHQLFAQTGNEMAGKQELRDKRGTLLGTIAQMSNGKLEGRDPRGSLKGTYDPRSNETRDSRGSLVGKGNMLAILVTSSL